MKDREYKLLEAIAEDETVTQAGLASGLGIAVGSVNWYIKRLISRGYLKATRMDRTRLRYNLTAEGMSAFTRNATQYMKDSLKIYRDLRDGAQTIVTQLKERGIQRVYLEGDDEIMDILRLTCIEANIQPTPDIEQWLVTRNGNGYQLAEKKDVSVPVGESL